MKITTRLTAVLRNVSLVLGSGLWVTSAALAQCTQKNVKNQAVDFRLTYDKASQRITAWYVPSISSTHRLVTGQFTIVTPDGFTAPETGSGQDSKLEITNINGSWQDFVFDNDLFTSKAMSPLASLEGIAVHQVGMAPQAIDIGAVTAGEPVPLFSFPSTAKEGTVRIVDTGEKVQKEILSKFGGNISNEISIQSPVKAFVRAEQLYCKNDVQKKIEFKKTTLVDPTAAIKSPTNAQTVGMTNSNDPDLLGAEQLVVTPNPATVELVVRYQLLTAGNAGIELVDEQGRTVQTIVPRRHHPIGKYYLKVALQDLAAGLYFCSLKGEAVQKTVKVMVAK
ncbi:putative secreted protein (Por secretion system target) [Larkinella arboricola]|uniref:Putative secreted protein (Por secretion system target) n=1 Tax=Larkinella arboricola TaxID=643671 RepID=A0A327X7Z2_LARAB|nr:T9SS type A sorting domain-containing protein [Larkinella arboricola]RAK02214.1 putative secreted protein (Por secretion system target) [Larkinella arboricola]